MMVRLDVPVNEENLDALDEFLSSDRSPPDCMQLSELDGYLTAIAIGPDLVAPSEWMPVIWGEEEVVFDGESEAQAVLGSLLGHYDAILDKIAAENYEPVLWSNQDGAIIAGDWASGFMEGVGLRAEAWAPLFDSDDDGYLLFPILGLCADENGDPLIEIAPEEVDRLTAEAPDILSLCVLGIAGYWKPRGRAPTVKSTPKAGRNDPCPCGSGEKFKKCCGKTA
jgi:uncharacterized protein